MTSDRYDGGEFNARRPSVWNTPATNHSDVIGAELASVFAP